MAGGVGGRFSFGFMVTRTRLPEVRLGVFLLPGNLIGN